MSTDGVASDAQLRATVYHHCFRLTESWADAEDPPSTVFLPAWRRRAQARVTEDRGLMSRRGRPSIGCR